MKKEYITSDTFVCFNNKQVKFAQMMMTLRLAKPVESGSVRHPITGKTEILIQKYETTKLISDISQRLFKHLMDSEGKQRLQRMKDCGALHPAEKPKEEIEQMGDLCVLLPDYK